MRIEKIVRDYGNGNIVTYWSPVTQYGIGTLCKTREEAIDEAFGMLRTCGDVKC